MKITPPMFILSMLLVACSSAPPNSKLQYITYQSHPEYGEVSLPNESYTRDSEVCLNDIYSKGVAINELLVTEKDAISAYRLEYMRWKIKAMMRAASGSYAHAGTMSALAVSTGNPSLASSSKNNGLIGVLFNSKPKSAKEPPKMYLEAMRLDNEIKQCIANKGWVKTKTERVYVPLENTDSPQG